MKVNSHICQVMAGVGRYCQDPRNRLPHWAGRLTHKAARLWGGSTGRSLAGVRHLPTANSLYGRCHLAAIEGSGLVRRNASSGAPGPLAEDLQKRGESPLLPSGLRFWLLVRRSPLGGPFDAGYGPCC
jgi:hypothetical protein